MLLFFCFYDKICKTFDSSCCPWVLLRKNWSWGAFGLWSRCLYFIYFLYSTHV